MIVNKLKKILIYLPQSIFATLGLFWLIIEPIIGLTGHSVNLSYIQLFGYSMFFGFCWLFVDGLIVSGFLKNGIEIKSSGFDTRIFIEFGDIFKENGWKAIPVNDFFDSIVDDSNQNSQNRDVSK